MFGDRKTLMAIESEERKLLQAAIQRERVAQAYQALFGADPSKRTDVQKLVWADLEEQGYARKPEWIADRDGRLCPHRAAVAGGRRSLFLYIESLATSQHGGAGNSTISIGG